MQLFGLSNDLHKPNNLSTKNFNQVAKIVAILRSQVENGRRPQGTKLNHDQNVIRIVSINDKPIPESVRGQSQP